MQAVYVREFGDIDAMELVDLPDPVPGPGEVLVRVRASGVNFAETRMRAGTYGGQVAPFVMGMESAGVVEAIGDGVSGFTIGQRVFGRARGSHAQKVVFDARHLMPLPDTLSFVE
ncbi:MAG: alcohol dehydrogenase catalytic domain-containing protein, partial [Dehalococcoidia bacterium]|nr:alcohol dehydrogenase catalytic domain-containing protein [Dehalococcoidia bacterium]